MSQSHGLDRVSGSLVPIDDEEVPTVHNEDNTIGVVDRKHIDAYVAAWGLVRYDDPFPLDHRQINQQSQWGEYKDFFHAADRAGIGLTADRLGAALQYVNPNPPVWEVDADEFILWTPTGEVYPYVLETSLTPFEFLVECQWGSRDAFAAQFGATSCVDCEALFDEKVIRCPECQDYPEAVQKNLEGLSEKHPGVLAILSPTDL